MTRRKRRCGHRRPEIKPVLLLLIALAALILVLGFRASGKNITSPINVQTSYAYETTGGAINGFPADFSADLSIDPAVGLLVPVSRGSTDMGATITSLAISRLGDPCFQQESEPSEYMDCSALVQWCYAQIGIQVPRTAADQAAFCQEHLLTIPQSQLQYGDLIFWSFEQNGRYKNISHTGIYVGNGKIIDASYSREQVVYRDLYSPEKIVMCARISGR